MLVRAMKCDMMLPQLFISPLDVMANYHKAITLNSALLSYRKPSTSDTTDTNDHVYYNTTSLAETGRNLPTCGIGDEPIPAEYDEISPTSKDNLTADSLNDYEVLAGVVVGDNNVAYTTLNRE